MVRYKRRAILATAAMLVVIIMQLPLPLLTMYIIDKLISPDKVSLLGIICLGLLLILIVRTLASLMEIYLLTAFRLRVVYDLKRYLYEHLLKLSLDYCHKKQTGYLISRVSGDIEGVQGLFADTFLSIVRNLLTFIVGLVMVYWLNVKLAVVATLLLPLYLLALFSFNKRLRRLVAENREAYANVFKYLQEHISGIAVIKAFVADRHDTIGMLKVLKNAIQKEFKSSMSGTVAALTSGFIGSLGPILLLWLGIIEIIHGKLTLGGLIAFNSFLVYLFNPLNSISNLNITVQNSLACAERAFEFIDLKPEIEIRQSNLVDRKAIITQGEVEFQNVSFAYSPGAGDVLSNVSFLVPAGKITAIVGRSGMGKSSIVNLLFRFYENQSGRITVDGRDFREYDLSYLRRSIGLVTQETFLFGYSIMENIKLGNLRATDDEVIEASKAAFAHDFIMNLPEQYQTRIGERGALISGGERQRIALARVFLKDPKILVLDEATSSLDSQSERYVKQAMEKLFINRSAIVISHRLSTIINADNIVLIDSGRVVDIGVHTTLYSNNNLYRRLYDEQFTEAGQKVGS